MRNLMLLFVLSFCSSIALAQVGSDTADTPKEYYLIKKNDGSEIMGEVLSDDGREVLLLSKKIGKIYIIKSDIASMTKIDQSKISVAEDGGVYQDYRLEGPYTTRYYFTTNALPIKKKENYMMLNLYGPEIHIAVNDNLSLGVMTTWIGSPMALAGKYSFDSETNTHFALGSIVGTSGYLLNAQGFGGLHWATITQGTRKANVSFSAGYAYASLGPDFGGFGGGQVGYKNDIANISEDDYNRYYAVRDEMRNRGVDVYTGLYKPDFRGSYVFGVSGITPFGKKSSFIFDVMTFLGPNYVASPVKTTTYQNVTYSYWDYNSGTGSTQNTRTEDIRVNENEVAQDGLDPTIIIMPAMRFNQSYDKAFQVALAGVVTTNSWGDIITFPIPTISWLRQF